MRYKNTTTFSYLRYISLRQKDYSGMRSGRGVSSISSMNVNRVVTFGALLSLRNYYTKFEKGGSNISQNRMAFYLFYFCRENKD